MSFIATANAITYTGAKPVFAEVCPETYNIDPYHTEQLITKRTKAILIVHQMGMPADIDAFKILCRRYNLILIEDAACALGSAYKGKRIGSHSELACFSFHPRKVITTGEGGMITTSNTDYRERLKLLRQHGMSINDRIRHLSKRFIIEDYLEIGYNYRLTDIQAAIGIKQLEKIDLIIAKRREIAERYRKGLSGIDCLRLPVEQDGYFTNYQSYPVYLKKNAPISRNNLIRRLLNNGISVKRGIMTSHLEPAYKDYSKGLRLPLSEDLSARSLLLPLYVSMNKKEIDFVISKVKKSLT
jgi:dTDP-4-amino-4,6-dideoxygalactose transaminase